MPSFLLHNPEGCTTCVFGPEHLINDEWGDDFQPGGIVVMGEAGGYNEYVTSRPFAGDSGRALEALLGLAGLRRANLYITNAVRHRPPSNKTPSKAQVDFHRPFVEAALAIAQPMVIIAVGGTALAWFRAKPSLTACHGKPFHWRNGIVVPMFHPAYAMRNPSIWPLLHADFALLRDLPEPRTLPIYRQGREADAVYVAHKYRRIGFDIETTDTKHEGVFYPHLQGIVGYSVAWGDGKSMYVPTAPGPWMQGVLEDEGITKVCHNSKFEYQVLRNYDITLRGFEDTKLKAYLLQHRSTHLKDLSHQLLGVEQLHLEDVTRGRPTGDVKAEEWVQYAAADADCTLQLDNRLSADLEREGLTKLYYDFELPLVPILADAERRGSLVHKVMFEELVTRLQSRREALGIELQEWFPGVNLNSVQQVGEVVFGNKPAHQEIVKVLKTKTKYRDVPKGLGLKSKKRTPGGKPALDKEVLAVLETKHPAMRVLAEYHRLGDYLSDFVEKIPRLLIDGVLHTSINQAGTWEEAGDATRESPSTGRLSSSGPNLMQIPKRDPELAKAIRSGFVARPGFVWVSVDMKQQEPRISAVVSGDKRLQSDFEAGVDIYMTIAHEFKQAVTKDRDAKVVDEHERDRWGLEYRDTAKNKVFLPVTYGAGAGKLASIHPGLTIEAASGILRGLHRRYPGLVEYARKTELELLETGYAVTLFGRKRWLPGIWVSKSRAEAARQGANHRIQGTGADVLKGCLIYLWGDGGKLLDYDAHLLWPIHDSIDMEVAEAQVDDVVEVVRHMTSWFTEINLPVEVSVGKSWGELL